MKTPFRHKNIRLPLDRYIGTGWFFVTFCCERRKKIFLEPTRAQWFLDNLRPRALSDALAIHAYCVMPDHVHLLSEGLTPTSDLLRFLTDLKRKTGFAFKQETRQQLWQKKSYDHALRSCDPPDLVASYIWMNPIRAGLCINVNDYPWSGSLSGAGPGSAPPHEAWSLPWRNQPAPSKEHLRFALAAVFRPAPLSCFSLLRTLWASAPEASRGKMIVWRSGGID